MHMEPYAYGKLSELIEELFADVRKARTKLFEHQSTFFIIAATDFQAEEDQATWQKIQTTMKRVKNFGSERIPDERLTVRNATIETILRDLWQLWLRASNHTSRVNN